MLRTTLSIPSPYLRYRCVYRSGWGPERTTVIYNAILEGIVQGRNRVMLDSYGIMSGVLRHDPVGRVIGVEQASRGIVLTAHLYPLLQKQTTAKLEIAYKHEHGLPVVQHWWLQATGDAESMLVRVP